MSDAELIIRVRNGDALAFSALMHAYYDTVAAVAYHILRSRDSAKDVAQDVFTRLWNTRTSLDPSRSVKGLLLKMAHNHALNLIKHDSVRERYEESVLTKTDNDDPITPEDVLLSNADFDALLDGLIERHQLALRLRYAEGMPYNDIADAMGVSPKAAEQLVIRALGALKRRLTQP